MGKVSASVLFTISVAAALLGALPSQAVEPVKIGILLPLTGNAAAAGQASKAAEEIGAEICNIHYLGTLENIFTFEGRPKHEIVLVYEADLVDEALYASHERIAHEIETTEPGQCHTGRAVAPGIHEQRLRPAPGRGQDGPIARLGRYRRQGQARMRMHSLRIAERHGRMCER